MNLGRLKMICLAVLLLMTASVCADAAEPAVYRLKNGLSVLVSADGRFPLVSVRLFVKAGSAWERPEEAGLSHMLEHMVFKGSATSGIGVDRKVENAGGSMNAYTSYDMTTYLTDLPSARWKEAMEAVRDLAFDPLLKQSDLDAEREVVIAEKKQRGDNPMTKLFQMAMASSLKGTPYETPVIGTEQALRSLTPEMMRGYISRRYDPRDMVLSIAGDVDARLVVEEAERLFGQYANRNVLQPVAMIDLEGLQRGMAADIRKGPWKKAFLSFSFPAPGSRHESTAAADVLAHLLAGDDTALLQRKFRIERPLVDDIDASCMTFERAGIIMLSAQLDAGKAEEAVRDMAGLLSSLKADDFTDDQLKRAVLNLEDEYYRSKEKIAAIAETAGREFFYDPLSVGGARWIAELQAVTKEKLQQVIDRWIRRDALTICALLPEKGEGDALDPARVEGIVSEFWTAEASAAKGKRADPQSEREVIDLDGKRKIILMPDTSLPYVSAVLTYSGGELLVPDAMEGLGTATARVITSAAKGKDFSAMNIYVSERASAISASCGTGSFSVSIDAPRRFAKDMFRLLGEVVEQPMFSPGDVERGKREQVAAIASREESVTGVMGRELRRFLFGKGPLSHRGEGARESVMGFRPDDLRGFWEKQKTYPWVLSVVGDFAKEDVLAFASGLPEPKKELPGPAIGEWGGAKKLELGLPGREQAVYLMVFPTVGSDHADRQKVRLLSECLSGFTGRLYQKVREERSLGYSVFPVDWAERTKGFLGFGVIAAPGKLEKAKEAFEEIVRELHSDVLPEETLSRAKAVAEADYHRARQSRAARAGEAAMNALNGRDLDYGARKIEEMKSVSAEELRSIAEKYLNIDVIYELTVKP